MVESLSGHLSSMLNARQLDLAVLFDDELSRAALAAGDPGGMRARGLVEAGGWQGARWSHHEA